MRLNIKAVKRQLDLSAEELDKEGFSDLADQVDSISESLSSADLNTVSEIKAKLLSVVAEKEKRVARKAELLTKIKEKLEKIRAGRSARKARRARLQEAKDQNKA